MPGRETDPGHQDVKLVSCSGSRERGLKAKSVSVQVSEVSLEWCAGGE